MGWALERNSTDIGCCWVRCPLTPTPDYSLINIGSINYVSLGDRYFHKYRFCSVPYPLTQPSSTKNSLKIV